MNPAKTKTRGAYLRTRQAMRFSGFGDGRLKNLALNGRVRTMTIDGVPGRCYHQEDLAAFIAETRRVLAS